MNLQVDFDQPTAVKVAQFFEGAGMVTAAARLWQAMCAASPYDRLAREKLGDLLFDDVQADYPLGTLARSQMILDVISKSLPSRRVRGAYLENLGQLLKTREKRSRPGNIVICVGPGRCGSTTLAAAVAGAPEACGTHENPPLIDWEPAEEQVRFHFDRLRLLADYYALVFDASHWWLNALGPFFHEFPAGKVIGLHREVSACVKSFLKIKGSGRGSANHWALPGNGIWGATMWDPTYPSYPVDPLLQFNPDAAKAAHIERYVRDYHQTLRAVADRHAGQMLLVRTEDLNDRGTLARLGDFLGIGLNMPLAPLNVGNTLDSDRALYRL